MIFYSLGSSINWHISCISSFLNPSHQTCRGLTSHWSWGLSLFRWRGCFEGFYFCLYGQRRNWVFFFGLGRRLTFLFGLFLFLGSNLSHKFLIIVIVIINNKLADIFVLAFNIHLVCLQIRLYGAVICFLFGLGLQLLNEDGRVGIIVLFIRI